MTITHPAVVQPAIQHSRPISSKGSEGRQCMPEHWDFYCSSPLLGRYILEELRSTKRPETL